MAAWGPWWGRVRRARWTAAASAGLALVAWIAILWAVLAGHDSRAAFADSRTPPDLAERFYPPENWAWGVLQLGAGPSQRYGVSAPDGAARAQVLILPDYGESAETWFETARDLNGADLTVWVLEGVGQGGSARLTSHRDLGQVASFDPDVAAARAMIDQVIRPSADAPLVLLGEGDGALIGARLVELGAKPAALILSAPACAPSQPGSAPLRALGLGDLRAPGAAGWTRSGPDDFAARRTHDPWRGTVTHRWQLANPDLRLGGPSLDWLAAARALARDAQKDAGRIRVPTLVLTPSSAGVCLGPPVAHRVTILDAGPALELEDEARRRPWLAAVLDTIAAVRAPPAPPLRSRSVTHLFKPGRRL